MAKIVYHVSAFDHSKKRDLEIKGTIREILTELKIQDMPVCVIINGVVPDECDLSYQTKDDDLIEIHKIVEGEGSASGKQSLALIVQIAAITATLLLPAGAPVWQGLAIMIGGSIISGALSKRALELSTPSGQDISETDISSNQYSLTNSSNQARPLQPMPLPMGSMRYSPDVQTQPLNNFINAKVTFGEAAPITYNFYPGQSSTNGAFVTNSNWPLMPAGYISSGFPQEDIRIAPYIFNIPDGPLSTAQNTYYIDLVKSQYLSTSVSKMLWNNSYAPLVVAHADSASPFYGRYNTMHFLSRLHTEYISSEYTSRMTALFGGYTFPIGGTPDLTDEAFYLEGSNQLLKVTTTLNYFYPSTIGFVDVHSIIITKLGAWLLALNGGTYSGTPKTSSYLIQKMYVIKTTTSIINEGIEYSTQVFNFGIGDLSYYDFKIGSYPILGDDYSRAVFSVISPYGSLFEPAWIVPSIPESTISPNYTSRLFKFFTNVLALDAKKLSNLESPVEPVSIYDNEQYNFILLEGKYGQGTCNFYISGQIYGTSGGGLSTNSCIIEIQHKLSTETTWTFIGIVNSSNGLTVVQNNNAKKVNTNYRIGRTVGENEKFQVRIRKVTLDSVNNESGLVCNLSVDKVRFYSNDEPYTLNAPQNLVGLMTTALVTDAAVTNKLSSTVLANCWYYDFNNDQWIWGFTRNPAFWFLYFCHGGFLNLEADSQTPYSYPYSPTTGWVNYPGHPDSTEQIFGVGLTNDEIDMTKILEWAEWCDDQVLTFDMVLKDDTSCSDVLERIANVGRASVTYVGGKISVVYENQTQVPTCMFGMGNIKAGSFSVNYQLQDPVRKVVLKYTNRETWEADQVEAIVPYSNAENIREVEISMEGVTEEQQAQRECNILAARQFYQRRTYSWEVDIEGLIAKRGDLVYLSHDATQYGYSGRVRKFLMSGANIIGFEGTAILDDSINYVTVKEPNGSMNIYACHVSGEQILFDVAYPLARASYFITNTFDNVSSAYLNSIPEDFTFIAGSKETPGKIVRISQVESSGDFTFKILAFDEDPAMWSYEYEGLPPIQSLDDSEVALSIRNTELTDLGAGMLRVNWECVNGDMIQILDEELNAPIEANGSYTFTGGQVTLSLTPGKEYTLILRPFKIGTPFKAVDKRERVWLK